MAQPGRGRRTSRPRIGTPLDIDLDDGDAFADHPLVSPFKSRYARSAILAEYAVLRLVEDLETLNATSIEERGRVAFTAVKGRVKEERSFFEKMRRACQTLARRDGLSRTTLDTAFVGVKDVAGVRFACPYYDEVVPAVNELVRPRLAAIGYGTDLQGEAGLEDRDHLDRGDAAGYRSYHFFLRVPTVIDIYGEIEPCVCEVQARTELQHVWADKSHELLYKPTEGWEQSDPDVVALMRQVSNNLRAVDEYLVDIRRRREGRR